MGGQGCAEAALSPISSTFPRKVDRAQVLVASCRLSARHSAVRGFGIDTNQLKGQRNTEQR